MEAKLITQCANVDDMTEEQYLGAFAALRNSAGSLDKFCVKVGSVYSKAQWSKLEHGTATLTRLMKSEIRRGMGEPELPPTLCDAVMAADPNAAVWLVRDADEVPHTVIMVAGTEPVTLHVNGVVTIAQETPTDERGGTQDTPKRARSTIYRPCASQAQESRRKALNASWATVIESGLKALEAI